MKGIGGRIVPIALAAILLAAAIWERIEIPVGGRSDRTRAAESATAPVHALSDTVSRTTDGVVGELSTSPEEIPAAEFITDHTVTVVEGTRLEQITWDVPPGKVPGILDALERQTVPANHYAVRRETGWEITTERTVPASNRGRRATAVSAPVPEEDLVPLLQAMVPRTPSLESATGGTLALAPDPSVVESGTPSDTSRSIGNGGAGFVLFRENGAMQWMWDAEILRLEPAR